MKYKIGDRVRCIAQYGGNTKIVGKLGKIINIGEALAVEFDEHIGGHNCATHGKYGHCWWIPEEYLEFADRYELHITCNDGKTTHAIYKKNGKIAERSKALCSPDDEFDFSIGAQEAFDRIFPSIQPQQEDKPTPKYKVGDKARIIKNTTSHHFPIGEIVRIIETGNTTGIDAEYLDGHDQWGVHFEDLEPYTEPEQEMPLIVTRKVLEKLGACSGGLAAFNEYFPSGKGEYEKVVSKCYDVDRDDDASWLEDHKDKIAEMQKKPEQEPIKLYCVKDHDSSGSHWLTKGDLYEIDSNGYFQTDFGVKNGIKPAGVYKSLKDFKNMNPDISKCLVPLVKRPAKVGETILIITDDACGANKGEIVSTGNSENFVDNTGFVWNIGASYLQGDYLVLDGYKPEPEYLNMEVVCTEGDSYFTVGKIYEFRNGLIKIENGDTYNRDEPIKSLNDLNDGTWVPKFIPYKGKADEQA